MAFHSNELKSTVTNSVRLKPALPWWTWVLPFFVANIGTWLSIWFKTDPGASLWYLPWQWAFLYAMPETLEVGLSWLFFIKFAGGQYWLPNLRNVGYFLF